ncbi:hypothetical protein [Enterococcus faecalis]|uniref:hypothetical protein n=1 Tax=Enterococcus faecalis TaxID=1351 RepID=UPI0003529C1C|nr:hypothetical protein [Enterococcus faecalis]EPH82646.1 hypothetical protein D927_01062 [Enterococcus faecalis 02-MB-BW-10]EPH86662.1 hypothetical protein D924_00558 [Enterococcus faecalis 06-MB-S-10]EPH90798.1 hypothetical protein D923_01157 [Enterococcus faecalis 06-MB-S-04]
MKKRKFTTVDVKQVNEWKDTIRQGVEEKHYLLTEKVNGTFEPIINIQESLTKESQAPFLLLLLLI